MKINELESIIKNKDSGIFAIVGPNTVGKSFSLNRIYENGNSHGLFIDEYGNYKCNQIKTKVRIANNKYIYENEERGRANTNQESELINDNSKSIIIEAKKIKDNLNSKYESSGSKKIKNMIEILLSLNLNHISVLYIDEPENYLDDKSIKQLKILFDTIISNNKKIVFVTHSPRLLEIVKVSINDIFIIPRLFGEIINLKYEDIKKCYQETAEGILKCSWASQLNFLDVKVPGTLTDIYLSKLLSSQDFYRTLFYEDVVLLEGLTEKMILEESYQLMNFSKNAVFCNGKFPASFFINLYKLFHKNIVCIFDSDNDRPGQSCNKINQYIQTLKVDYPNLKIIFVDNNIEDLLDIKDDEIYKDILREKYSNTKKGELIRKYKPYVSVYQMRQNPSIVSKVETLFHERNEYDEWIENN